MSVSDGVESSNNRLVLSSGGEELKIACGELVRSIGEAMIVSFSSMSKNSTSNSFSARIVEVLGCLLEEPLSES